MRWCHDVGLHKNSTTRINVKNLKGKQINQTYNTARPAEQAQRKSRS